MLFDHVVVGPETSLMSFSKKESDHEAVVGSVAPMLDDHPNDRMFFFFAQ